MRLGTTELLLIFGLAVLLFGGSRLAGLGKAMGKSIREFKQEVHSETEESASGSTGDGKQES